MGAPPPVMLTAKRWKMKDNDTLGLD